MITTNKDVTINFRNYGEITVPKGTKLTHFTAMGYDPKYHFVAEYGWIKENYADIAVILMMDATTYGINIPVEHVTVTEKPKTRMQEYNGKMVQVEDMTPTWSGILPTLLLVLQDGNAEGKATAKKELQNMAAIADRYVAITKEVN